MPLIRVLPSSSASLSAAQDASTYGSACETPAQSIIESMEEL